MWQGVLFVDHSHDRDEQWSRRLWIQIPRQSSLLVIQEVTVVVHKMLWMLPQGINLKTEHGDEQFFTLKLKNRVTFPASLKKPRENLSSDQEDTKPYIAPGVF